MSASKQLEGACLCGAVTVRVTPPEPHVEACHCDMCRRWGGGPFLSLKTVSDPAFSGDEHIVRYASSEWAERGFCRECGTHLFYFYKPKAGYSFTAGLFDGADAYPLVEEIFVDEAPGYDTLAEGSEKLTGPQVIAKFQPGGED